MRVNRIRSLVSYALVGAGAILLFLGARDFIESRLGQSEAARDYAESRAPESHTAEPTPVPGQGDVFAKLTIPRLEAQLFVVEGDRVEDLRRGPGHLLGTVMPGAKGNCVIAGHRDTHFRILRDIRKGDDIVLLTQGGEYIYRVRSTKVVSPEDTEPLQPTRDPQLHLITCYPFYYLGSAPRRFVVEASLRRVVASVDIAPSS